MANINLILGPYSGNIGPFLKALRSILNSGFTANLTIDENNIPNLYVSPNGTVYMQYIDDNGRPNYISTETLVVNPN